MRKLAQESWFLHLYLSPSPAPACLGGGCSMTTPACRTSVSFSFQHLSQLPWRCLSVNTPSFPAPLTFSHLQESPAHTAGTRRENKAARERKGEGIGKKKKSKEEKKGKKERREEMRKRAKEREGKRSRIMLPKEALSH